jgi:predicted ATPase
VHPTSSAQTNIFARSGAYWTLSYRGKQFSLKDSKGLNYIQRLLQNPNHELRAVDLLSEPSASITAEAPKADEASLQSCVGIGGLGDAGEALDNRAKQEYNRRLLELRDELQTLRGRGDFESADRVQAEIDSLQREVLRAVGPSVRRVGPAAERARINVTRAIKSALKRISEHHSALGQFLDGSIRTGSSCSYVPHLVLTWQCSLETSQRSGNVDAPGPEDFQPVTQPPAVFASTPEAPMVGREEDLTQLRNWYTAARESKRRVVFVTGEPGIGKTTLVRRFLEMVADERTARIGRGQCIEQYGGGEPYMPVLEALTRLCQQVEGERLVEILNRHAPTWLAQMPALLTERERTRLQGEMQSATRQRMLREMAEAIEALAAESPLILFLEDLHWSDFSTLELISVIARRAEPARLLIVGTYRPLEIPPGNHPLRALKQELQIHRQCEELRLRLLSQDEIASYLRLRLEPGEATTSLGGLAMPIHKRTEGNPLFMVNVVDYLVSSGVLGETGKSPDPSELSAAISHDIPPNLLQLIERNLERLATEESYIVQAASLVGAEFSAAAAAAAAGQPLATIEECCSKLARHEQFVRAESSSQWPDGTVATRYEFLHALYREVLYERVPVGQRAEQHRRIAERLEAAWGEGVKEIAAELAFHYGCCRNKPKALTYLELAGELAVARRAYREAEQHYRDALAVLQTLRESPERDARELTLQVTLGGVMEATRGWSAIDTAEVYGRARALAEQSGSAKSLEVLLGLWGTMHTRGDQRAALRLADEMLAIARGLGTRPALTTAHYAEATPLHYLGQLIRAREHYQLAIDHYREEDFRGIPVDAGMISLSWMGPNDWHLGYADRAVNHVEAALARARRQNNPAAVVFALTVVSYVSQLRRDFKRAMNAGDEAVELAAASGLTLLKVVGKIRSAWARAQIGKFGGANQIQEGLAEFDSMKFCLARAAFLAFLSEAQAAEGKVRDAFGTAERALQTNIDELLYRPELLRLRGELKLRSNSGSEVQVRFESAERDFREAIEIARLISAKSYELRATASLARLLEQRGHREEGYAILFEICGWFKEGFDTADLKEAKALLEELRG